MNKILLLVAMIAGLVSCQRESMMEEDITRVVIDPPQEEVQGSITGLITDQNGAPISEATISYQGNEFITDAQGEFTISNTVMYEDGTYLTAEKSGFFLGSRKFYPQANELNRVRIELIDNKDLSTFQTNDGGTVYLDEEQKSYVVFPNGDYLQDDGSRYTGEVRVQGVWLDPQLESTYYRMPGDLTGLTLEKEIKSLIPFGFAKVQLIGTNSEKLQLPEETQASIYFPVDASPNDPADLNLWHFDEQNGIWVEEGIAELEGAHYRADVEHFTFWNITQLSNTADLDIELVINNMSSIDAKLVLSGVNTPYKSIQRTSDSGKARFSIPSDTELELEIFYDCEDAVHTSIIEPLQGDNNPKMIELELTQELTLNGMATTCSGEPLDNGLVYVEMGAMKYLYRTTEQGQLEIEIPRCERTAYTVSLIDIENGKASNAFVPTTDDISNISICNDDVETGYSFDFQDIDWLEEMQEQAIHSWTVSTIAGTVDKKIFNPLIENKNDDSIYFSGAFVINPDEVTANYLLYFEADGFSIRGTCSVEKKNHSGLESYRFSGTSQQIRITDFNLFNNDITQASFNVVYYN